MSKILELDSILKDWADNVIARIQQNMETEGVNASGATSASLEAVLTDTGIQILGAPYFAEKTEIGRTPTVHKETFDFAAVIAKWIEDKNIKSTFGITDDRDLQRVAKAIAMKISLEGSAKYRGDRPQTDVYSTVFAEELDNLNDIIAVSGGEVLMGIFDDFERKAGEIAGKREV